MAFPRFTAAILSIFTGPALAGPVDYLSADRFAYVRAKGSSTPIVEDRAQSDDLGRFEGNLYAEQRSAGDISDPFTSAMHYRSLLLQDRIVTRTESQFGGREQFTYNRNLKFTSQIEFRLTEVTEVSFRLDQISGEDYTVQENSVSVFSVGADRDLFNEHIDDDRLRTHWRRVLNPGVFRFRLEINEFSDRTGWSDHQWVLQLPSPSSASLIMLGMIGLTRRRR